MVQFVKTLPEYKAIIQNTENKLIIVDFTATWCGPCRQIAPVFESLASKYPGVVLYKVDVDEASDIAAEYGIRAMPTFHFYKDGNKVDELCGAIPSKLESLVQQWTS
ncbi:hypothetical protein GDO81_001467 [Engystomops pustulosus]|uniref:Thioredoxin domain-containing protein n=1 Tax=Engystomops pustulosus TaxID=76066 RepID=A0AAV7DF69_ENGPU|nr:hypothetical protein GDO81_001467 [Engystomops pustulosus]